MFCEHLFPSINPLLPPFPFPLPIWPTCAQQVAESEQPPLSLGYLYLFKRDDAPDDL